jgi:cystathionine gamma-synthase
MVARLQLPINMPELLVLCLQPGLPHCEGYEVAQKQMAGGFGGIVSFTVKGGNDAAMRVAANVRLFTRASSLGGVESLIEHRASSPVQTRGRGTGFQINDSLLRLSIGLKNADDLTSDLANALAT